MIAKTAADTAPAMSGRRPSVRPSTARSPVPSDPADAAGQDDDRGPVPEAGDDREHDADDQPTPQPGERARGTPRRTARP